MDQGVIWYLKAKYRQKIIQRLIKNGFQTTSSLDAIQSSSWSEVSETTVKYCFKKAGISKEAAEEALNDQDDPFIDLSADELPLKIFTKDFPKKFPRS